MRLGAGFNKLVSFAIVWCMVISSFLGVVLVAIPNVGVSAQGEVPVGDTIVGTGYHANITQGSTFDGNLTIRAGGMVMISNSSLIFRSSCTINAGVITAVKALTLTVEDGGILILDNSTLTMDVKSGNPIPALGVVVRHGGYFESRTSNISFSGHLLVDDATFDLIDSTVSGLTPVYSSTYFPTNVFSSSPVMLFMSSNVTMIGSSIYNMYDNGTTNTVGSGVYNNNYQFAKDTAARQIVDYYLERDVNAAFGTGTTATGTAVSMTMNDTKSVRVASGQTLSTTGFDMGGLVFEAADVSSLVLHVTYKTGTGSAWTGTDKFYYTPQYASSAIASSWAVTQTYLDSNPSGTNVNTTKDISLTPTSAQSLAKLTLNYTNTKSVDVYIDRIWVTIDMKLATYRNITIGGSTNLIVADSYIPLNDINENNGVNAAKGAYHKLVALDQSVANLYDLTVHNSTGGYLSTSVFMTKNHAVILRPDVIGASDTTVGNSLSRLQSVDASYYIIGAGKIMQISHFNAGDLVGKTANVTIDVRYRTSAGYANGGYIAYSFNGVTYTNTNILIVDRSSGDLTTSFSIPGKHTLAELSNLRIQYDNSIPTGSVSIDAIWLDVRSEPTFALYRWAFLNVTDAQSMPVSNVGVSAIITGSTVNAYYLYQTGVANTPPQAILDYLGKSASNYNRTSSSGFIKIPLLSDVINITTGRNGKAFDYNLVCKYRDANALYVLDENNGGVSTNFASFPDLTNNSNSRVAMFRTLSVVFGPLTISSGTRTIGGIGLFQVKGDIIVNGTGRLVISSGILQIMNDRDNQFKITVSGSGSIVLNGGTITSDLAMQIFLTDNAVFSASNESILPGNLKINIDGNSRVILADDGFVAAQFIAPATSYGNLTATNVTFLSNLTSFGGHAKAVFTGVSLARIALQDQAYAWNYRWLTVTVMDGTQIHGIPNAYVEVDRWSTGSKYASARTDAGGNATFRVLSDRITSSGAPHFDNYVVNTTYWFGGQAYQSAGDTGRFTTIVPEGLRNAGTQIAHADITTNVVIPNALPELDPPFWVSDYSPERGVTVLLTANVTNIGVVTAYDVLVRFKDISTGETISDVTIASIAPNAYSNITVPWIVTYPVGNHILNVTIDPYLAIPQADRSGNWNQTVVSVQGVPDLGVITGLITLNPANPVANSTVSIRADITNSGDNMDQTAVISFYDVYHGSRVLIGNFTLPAIRGGQTGVALMTWQNTLPGEHNITVVIDEKNLIMEASKDNNNAGLIVDVLNYPDLVATNMQFKLTGTESVVTQVFIGDSVTLDATVMNTGESVASDFIVRFWLGTPGRGTMIGDVVVPSLVSGATADLQTSWIATAIDGSGRNQSRMVTVEVNPFTHGNDTPIKEMRFDNNIVANSLLVIDNRADLWFPNGVSITPYGSTNTTSNAVQGQTINITFQMANQGLKSVSGAVLNIYVIDSDNFTHLLMTMSRDLPANVSVAVSFPWVVNVTAGVYTLVVEMNSQRVILESDYTNNIDSRNFTINLPDPLITINVGGKTDFQPGVSIQVYGKITNAVGAYPLANQSITIRLLDDGGLQVGQAVSTMTDKNGDYSSFIFVPTDRSGQHSVSVTMNAGAVYSSSTPINIVQIFKPQSVSLSIFIVIAIIVMAVILIFSVYLYKYGLGKMVECGECGALIPESSKRCPRCSTEFETETAKCSECGTWIPARSKECPECGAKFMTEPVEEVSQDDYMATMRSQYDEYVNGFRDQAKAALGKKYSEEKFMDWLKTEPAYLTFDAWVAKQEESRKVGAVPCPSCGTLNPKGATICSKCGTVFERVPEATPIAEPAEPAKPFRKIVKRSSERKMVPKKTKEVQDQTEKFDDLVPLEEKKE